MTGTAANPSRELHRPRRDRHVRGPNAEDGIWLDGGSGNTVGGTVTAARDVMAGNGWSGRRPVRRRLGHVIQGNSIGINASGAALGNLRNGVQISDGTGTQVGGTAAGAGNVIANNGASAPSNWAGVAINPGNSHSVLGNLIYNDSGLGIDLGSNGATPKTARRARRRHGPQRPPELPGADLGLHEQRLRGAEQRRVQAVPHRVVRDPTADSEGQRFLGQPGHDERRRLRKLQRGDRGDARRMGHRDRDGDARIRRHVRVQRRRAGQLPPVNSGPGPQNLNEDSPLVLNTISVSDFEGDSPRSR